MIRRLAVTSVAVLALQSSAAVRAEEPAAGGKPALAESAVQPATALLHWPVAASVEDGDPAQRLLAIPAQAKFQPLLDPAGGLSGWSARDGRDSAWNREQDLVSCLQSGGGWLCSPGIYSDFVLRFDYRLAAGGSSGVAIRVPETGNPTTAGIEIQLLDDHAEKFQSLRPDQYTGSIYYIAAPQRRADVKPAGEWNTCEVTCLGDQLSVRINSRVVNVVQLDAGRQADGAARQLSQKPPLGRIALQSHTSRVDFRDPRILDLTTKLDSGVRIVDLSPGEGPTVNESSQVKMHYVGQLADGRRFVDTRDLGGDAPEVSLPRLIPGLREGLQGQRAGGLRRMIVPASHGYGAAGIDGQIPADATLVYQVELVSVGE